MWQYWFDEMLYLSPKNENKNKKKIKEEEEDWWGVFFSIKRWCVSIRKLYICGTICIKKMMCWLDRGERKKE